MIVGKSAVLVEFSAVRADFSKRLVNFCTFQVVFPTKCQRRRGCMPKKKEGMRLFLCAAGKFRVGAGGSV